MRTSAALLVLQPAAAGWHACVSSCLSLTVVVVCLASATAHVEVRDWVQNTHRKMDKSDNSSSDMPARIPLVHHFSLYSLSLSHPSMSHPRASRLGLCRLDLVCLRPIWCVFALALMCGVSTCMRVSMPLIERRRAGRQMSCVV